MLGNPICRQIGTVAVVALAVATFLSAGPAQAQVTDPVAVTNQVLALMNKERAAQGAPALIRHCLLDKAADRHAKDMAANNFFSHIGSDGSYPSDRVRAAGYTTPGPGAENIAASASTAEGVVAAWMASTQGHREAILSPEHREVGIAVAYGRATQYRYYWCAVFKGGPGPACTPTGETGGAVGQSRSLGGVATASPKAAYDADGRLYLFVRGTDGAVWYRSRGALTSNWADWISLGGFIKDNLSLGAVSGRLAVFARGGDDALWYTVRQGGGFAPWVSLGGVLTSEPAAAQVGGRARVFVRGTDGVPWYRGQNDAGQWMDWKNLGGGITGAPTVTLGSDGRLIILARGGGGFWLRDDPHHETPGVQPWKWIGFEGVDPVLAPGSGADSPVIMWSNGNNLQWGYQSGGQWLGGASARTDGSPYSRTITSRLAVAPRPAGGFYLAVRRDGGALCVTAEALDPQSGLGFPSKDIGSASNVTGSGDLSVVADSGDGRPVVFSLNASGATEERWF